MKETLTPHMVMLNKKDSTTDGESLSLISLEFPCHVKSLSEGLWKTFNFVLN